MEELSKTSDEYGLALAEINKTLVMAGLPPNKYPGGQPIHINETQMMDVLKKKADGDYKYSLNLKSDGVRYLMFGGPLVNMAARKESSKITDFRFRRPYFINRRFGIFKIVDKPPHAPVLIESRTNFILDGEIIEYDSKKKNHFHLSVYKCAHIVFNIFDALLTPTASLKSASYARWGSVKDFITEQKSKYTNKDPIQRRAIKRDAKGHSKKDKQVNYAQKRKVYTADGVIEETISKSGSKSPLKEASPTVAGYSFPHTFEMVLSEYFSLKELQGCPKGADTFRWLASEENFGKVTPGGYKIPYDGLVFTPVDFPYVRGPWVNCTNVAYKWKPRANSTIDVAIQRKSGKVTFHTKTGFEITRIPASIVDLLPSEQEAPSGTVVELRFWGATNKRFEFTRIRQDKNKNMANGKKTVDNVIDSNFDLDFLREFVQNPSRENISKLVGNLQVTELKNLALKMAPVRPALEDKLLKMSRRKDTFLRIDYPADKWHEACKCIGSLYTSHELILFTVAGIDYASVGLSGSSWIRRQAWDRKQVGKAIKINKVKISEIKYVPMDAEDSRMAFKEDNTWRPELLENGSRQTFRYVFNTHFGEITFEKRFDRSKSGELSRPKLSIYTEIKRNKTNDPKKVFNLIKEFSFYLSKRRTDRK